MRRYSFPLTIGAMLLVLFGVSIWFASPDAQSYPPLVSRSNQPDGARALRLWLETLGYRPRDLDRLPYAVDPAARLLLVLDPGLPPFQQDDADRVGEWVEAGGTLILAVDSFAPTALLERLGLESEYGDSAARAGAAQPLLRDPPVATVRLDASLGLRATRGGAVPLLAADGRVVALERPLGRGRVIALASARPFSNAGLADPAAADLVLNLLRGAPPGSEVLFDEVHHGLGRRPGDDLLELLVSTAPGRAILLALLVVFAYLLLGGRRFGRPLAAPPRPGRSAGEYVSAMAALFRRAGKRDYLARHFERELRRDAARAVGLEPLADEQAIAARARERGHDPAPLLEALARLRGGRIGEGELLRAVQQGEASVRALREPRAAGRQPVGAAGPR